MRDRESRKDEGSGRGRAGVERGADRRCTELVGLWAGALEKEEHEQLQVVTMVREENLEAEIMRGGTNEERHKMWRGEIMKMTDLHT